MAARRSARPNAPASNLVQDGACPNAAPSSRRSDEVAQRWTPMTRASASRRTGGVASRMPRAMRTPQTMTQNSHRITLHPRVSRGLLSPLVAQRARHSKHLEDRRPVGDCPGVPDSGARADTCEPATFREQYTRTTDESFAECRRRGDGEPAQAGSSVGSISGHADRDSSVQRHGRATRSNAHVHNRRMESDCVVDRSQIGRQLYR